MNFLQLVGDYLDIELGTADRTVLFTSARRGDAVNRAQLEFVKQTECFTRQVTISLADGTAEYDLDATGIISSGDFLWIAKQGVVHKFIDANANATYTVGEDFPRIDIAELDLIDPGSRSATATNTPTSYYIRQAEGSCFIGVYPSPEIGAGESASLTVPYVAVPATMVADADEPFSVVAGTSPLRTLRPWHQALVHYAAALLEPLRKNYSGEQRQRQLFAGYVADYLQRDRPKGVQRIQPVHDYYRAARGGRALGSTSWADRT